MKNFYDWLWLIAEAQRPYIDPAMKADYEAAFKEQLRSVIGRTENPQLRERLIEMLDCPIKDSRGQCRSFVDYIASALIRNGIHEKYDMEQALSYVVEKMLLDKTDTGEPRITVFGGFEERPEYVEGNPLQARFMKFLDFAVRNIARGRIPRLANAGQWPPGTVSISQGRSKEGEPGFGISSDQLMAKSSSGDKDFSELIADIQVILRRLEPAYGVKLADLFQDMLRGVSVEEQRQRFGDKKTRAARQVILDAIKEYAESSGNFRLKNLLDQIQNPKKAASPVGTPTKRPVLSDKERDYASIVNVISRFERPVGSADLGRYRRRWLEYPPRMPGSGFRNRLEEVLVGMTKEGVLKAVQRSSGAVVYEPGPEFDKYRQ